MRFSLFATAMLLLLFTPYTLTASERQLVPFVDDIAPTCLMHSAHAYETMILTNDGYALAESWHLRERNWLLTNAALKRVLGFGITTA